MKAASASAFTDARKEIQLWPAAAMAFVYVESGAEWALWLLVVLLFTAASTFKLHSKVQEKANTIEAAGRKRRQVSRTGVSDGDQSYREASRIYIHAGGQIWRQIAPDGLWARGIVFLAMMLNLVVGIGLYFGIGFRVLTGDTLSVAGVALFALPTIMLAGMLATMIWNS